MAGLGDMFGQSMATVNGQNPRNSNRIQAGQPLNLRGAFEAATNIPVVGDALSGGMAMYDAAKGDYGSAAMNAVGLLPFVPGVAGMIGKNGENFVLRDVLGSPVPNAQIGGFGRKTGTYSTPEYYAVSSTAENMPLKGNKYQDFDSAVNDATKSGFSVASSKGLDGHPKASLLDDYTNEYLNSLLNKDRENFKNSKDVFIRYGDIPKNGISKNYRDGTNELGTSVFHGMYNEVDGRFKIIPKTNDQLGTKMFMNDRPVYIVDGTIIGYGSDGEPLLRGASVVKKISK